MEQKILTISIILSLLVLFSGCVEVSENAAATSSDVAINNDVAFNNTIQTKHWESIKECPIICINDNVEHWYEGKVIIVFIKEGTDKIIFSDGTIIMARQAENFVWQINGIHTICERNGIFREVIIHEWW